MAAKKKNAGTRALESLRRDAAEGSAEAVARDLAAVGRHWKKDNPQAAPWLAGRCAEALARFRGDARSAHAVARAAIRLARHPRFEKPNRWRVAAPVLQALAWDPAPAIEKRAMLLLAGEAPHRIRELLDDVLRQAPPAPASTVQRDRLLRALRRLTPDRVMRSHGWTPALALAEVGRYRGEDDLAALFTSLYADGDCTSLYIAARALGPQRGTVRQAALDVPAGKLLLVHGNLDVPASDVTVEGALVVLGNLSIGGTYRDRGSVPCAVVAGDVGALAFEVTGSVLAAGGLSALGSVRGETAHASISVGTTLACEKLLRRKGCHVDARRILLGSG